MELLVKTAFTLLLGFKLCYDASGLKCFAALAILLFAWIMSRVVIAGLG